MNTEEAIEKLKAMWSMCRKNELYTEEMFIEDMLPLIIKKELKGCCGGKDEGTRDDFILRGIYFFIIVFVILAITMEICKLFH